MMSEELLVPAEREISPATDELSVLENKMAESWVWSETVPVLLLSEVALTKVMVAPDAVPVMSPEVKIPEEPVNDTAPEEKMSPAAEIVKAPPSALRVTAPVPAPDLVVVMAPFKLIVSATKFNPAPVEEL